MTPSFITKRCYWSASFRARRSSGRNSLLSSGRMTSRTLGSFCCSSINNRGSNSTCRRWLEQLSDAFRTFTCSHAFNCSYLHIFPSQPFCRSRCLWVTWQSISIGIHSAVSMLDLNFLDSTPVHPGHQRACFLLELGVSSTAFTAVWSVNTVTEWP